ncbi:MAG: ABC transporter permease [Rhodospirillaceae bacterium]|nr:ABC transporter permease [Rhodospirillaceae bacterium]
MNARSLSMTPPAGAMRSSEEESLLRQAAAARRSLGRRRLIDRIVLCVLVLGAWEAVVATGLIHPFFISQPSMIAVDLYELFASGMIFKHFVVTMYEALAGLALGVVLGVATGFAAALSARIADALQPLIVAFNSMPRVAIAPLFIIWFGFGPASKIALAALVVYFVIFFNTFSGMRAVEPVLMNSVRVMGASKVKVLWMVSLPFTMAWVFAAMKTSISMALIGAVVGEFIGSVAGIGWIMVQAAGTNDTTRLFSTLIILAVVGAALFALLRWAEDHVLRWRPRNDL